MNAYVRGTWLLLQIYLEQIKIIWKMPTWLTNPDDLTKLIQKQEAKEKGSTIELKVKKEFADRSNKSINDAKIAFRKLHADEKEMFEYKTQLYMLIAVRFACIVSAYHANVKLTMLLSCLQFVVAPYSLFVSGTLALALIPPIYASHYISFLSLRFILDQLFTALGLDLGWLHMFSLTIDKSTVLGFIIIDQLLCIYCHYCLPSKEMSFKETLTHAVWGFVNTKTYHIVLLLHMQSISLEIPLIIWLIDSAFALTDKLSKIISRFFFHWLGLFYPQHRLAHLPKVYEHAHKLHHYLHGTNSFDAHIYGNGLPEEFFILCIEMLFGLWLRVPPTIFNALIMQHSIDNKIGHTQKPQDDLGDNFHADHHILHIKNFGIYNSLMDMYFCTSNYNERYKLKASVFYNTPCSVYDVEKIIQEDEIVFRLTPS